MAKIEAEMGMLYRFTCTDCGHVIMEHWDKEAGSCIWKVSYLCKCETDPVVAKSDMVAEGSWPRTWMSELVSMAKMRLITYEQIVSDFGIEVARKVEAEVKDG